MPHQIDFDPVNHIMRWRMEGKVTDEELSKWYREARELAERLQPRAGIVDLSQVTSFEVSSQAISALADQAPVISNPHWPRVVIAPAPSVFGVMRMFQLRGDSARPSLRVVYSHSEAWAILSLEKEPEFKPVPNS